MKRRNSLIQGFIYMAAILVAIWTLAPYVWLIISSISRKVDLLQAPLRWIPPEPTLANYRELLSGAARFGGESAPLLLTMRNSLIVAFGATVISLTIGVFSAYALARLVFPGHRHYMVILMASQMMPPIAIVIPGYMILNRLEMLDTHIGLILAYITFILPLVIWIMRGYFASIPSELEDAARIDGCTRIGALFRVVLPLSGPGLVSTSIFCFIAAWNEFLYAFIFTSTGSKTLPVLIGEYSTKVGIEYLKMASAGVVASIPPVLLALIFQRFIIRGLTAGAMKG